MSQSAQETVRVSELEEGMLIQEVTELSFDYASLDPSLLAFLRKEFEGAHAVVVDGNDTRTVPVDKLEAYDQLQALVQIPPNLEVARVGGSTRAHLEHHGMLEFKVVRQTSRPDPAPAGARVDDGSLTPGSQEARRQHAEKMEQVRSFLDTLEPGAQNREEASTAVEEMLDLGRRGSYSTKGVEHIVEEIISQGSSPAMKAIAGLKGSDQTYAHCTDMSVILQECYTDILRRSGKAPNQANMRFSLISGFLHDIGKSEVPKEILDSTERFAPDSREMMIMRNHTTYGARILGEMEMPEITINVAHYHHVKKDPTLLNSYPDVAFEDVMPLTRLASIVDVYQALIGKRRYKRNWVPGKAVQYLLNLKGSEFDDRMLEHFVESMGLYPVGSLVRLSTGELGFVLVVGPQPYPERPIVAVVENKAGELLTHHHVVDLMLEPDVSVEEVVDHYEHFAESEDQSYRIFSSIRLQEAS